MWKLPYKWFMVHRKIWSYIDRLAIHLDTGAEIENEAAQPDTAPVEVDPAEAAEAAESAQAEGSRW